MRIQSTPERRGKERPRAVCMLVYRVEVGRDRQVRSLSECSGPTFCSKVSKSRPGHRRKARFAGIYRYEKVSMPQSRYITGQRFSKLYFETDFH